MKKCLTGLMAAAVLSAGAVMSGITPVQAAGTTYTCTYNGSTYTLNQDQYNKLIRKHPGAATYCTAHS